MTILDGKLVASQLESEIRSQVETLAREGARPPHLLAILVGEDPASEAYVASKRRKCRALGFQDSLLRFPSTVTQDELLAQINRLNADPGVDGYIVQLPLPSHIDEEAIIHAIDPEKDVDGFHPINLGRMLLGQEGFRPATPHGILRMLEYYMIPTQGKHLVVLGRSRIVGQPVANMLARKSLPGDCTVTLCHSHTQGIERFTRQADILIAALGIPGFVRGDMVKEGVVVIDVGINRVSDPTRPSGHRLVGDVDFDQVAPLASYITPVPGGVGPMTIIALMENTLQARLRAAR